MLYLAEVQRRRGVIGAGRAEFRMLALQRAENSWIAVTGEEIYSAPDDVPYNAGVLVMVEVSNKQVQRHSEAGRQIVSILQNFSRLQEKFKTQEEEIEQWKESLIYQSEELNKRQAAVETREDKLNQMEEDFVLLEQQKQEIEGSRDELNRLKEEFERRSQELEGAWAHLRGEMNRFEEQKSELQQVSVLDEGKAHHLQELLNRLSGAIAPIEAVREQLHLSFEIINHQQNTVEQHYQTLDHLRATAHQMQESVDHQTGELQVCWEEWKQAQADLENMKADLRSHQQILSARQEHAELLHDQIQQQQELYRQACQLADASGIPVSVDVASLENRSLDELQKTVSDLEQELNSTSRFVQSQEEELTLQQEAIDELKQKISQASEYDRLQLEAELADEQDRYRMLNETLVGQRRSLQERQAILKAHQTVLARRQGVAVPDPQDIAVDLSPMLNRLDAIHQDLSQALQTTQEQIQALQTRLGELQGTVDQRNGEQEARWNELKQQQQDLQNMKAATGEQWGKVNTYQESLSLLQSGVGGLKDKLEAIAGVIGQFQEASDYQLQAIAEMQQTVLSLMQNQNQRSDAA